jgi:hypothetical protein
VLQPLCTVRTSAAPGAGELYESDEAQALATPSKAAERPNLEGTVIRLPKPAPMEPGDSQVVIEYPAAIALTCQASG